MKLIKTISVKQEFYKLFGGKLYFDKKANVYKNRARPEDRKYGNIKDPKGGKRPYLLFKDDNNQLWVVPSTSAVSNKKAEFIKEKPFFHFTYWRWQYKAADKKINLGKNQTATLQFLDMHLINQNFLCSYRVSRADIKNYWYSSTNYEAISNNFLKNLFNTNYFIQKGLKKAPPFVIDYESDSWNKYIKCLENKAAETLKIISKVERYQWIKVKHKNLIEELNK